MRRRRFARGTFAALVIALVVGAAVSAPPAALAAAPTFPGGIDDAPLYVANDHTAVAVHYVASGLAASTTYSVKVRFIVGTEPNGPTNRGFTWNPTTNKWVQERDDWSAFPKVITDGTGAIVAADGWVFVKFADVTKTGAYRLIVSLSTTGTSGSVKNGVTRPLVTVLDMTSGGFWAHDGAATGATAARRAEALDHTTGVSVLALQKTEAQAVDDDANGTVDDEDYGPPGATGDFRFAVPLGQAFDIQLSRTPWAPGANVSGATADVDLALGAADQSPPTAPGGLQATAAAGAVDLSWAAAGDDTGVTAYHVFRWTDPAPINGSTQYTSATLLVGTTAGTVFHDAAVTNGTAYHYLVRAADAATNLGPRSGAATATPGSAATTLSLTASATIVKYGGAALLTGTLQSSGSPVAGQMVTVESSPDGVSWTPVTTITSASGAYPYAALPIDKTRYRMSFAGTVAIPAATSNVVTVTPRVFLGTPTAPTSVRHRTTFAVYGALKPRHTAGAHSVVLEAYKRVSGKWVLKKTVRTTNADFSTYTRYKVKTWLPSAGSWRLRAVAPADALHALTKSSYRSVTVK